jgi:NAD(P)-dependent dehydrogenase (short-subunit alcohol dehydrogenase family)
VHVAITGGARGIGLATVRAFRAAGAIVSIGDIDLEAAEAALAGSGGPDRSTGHAVRLDVRDPESFEAFLAGIGPIDILVNNAGVAVPQNFVSTPAGLRDLQIDVNLRGVVNGMAAALPRMLEQRRGQVVNVASLAGRLATPNAAIYTATKAAVIGLTEAVRAELHGTGVLVSAVLPTFVPTEMTAGLPLRGVPKTTAEEVARVIVRVVHRGSSAVVTVPRWLGVAPRIAALLPQRLVDRMRASATGDLGEPDPLRLAYARRVERLLERRDQRDTLES